MRRFHLRAGLSLPARFVLGVGLLLLPLVGLGGAAMVAMHGTITRFDRAVTIAQRDSARLAEQESLLRSSAVNDAVENRVANPRPAYDAFVASVEGGFDALVRQQRPDEEARLVASSYQEWTKARAVVDGLLVLPVAERSQVAADQMKTFRTLFYASRDHLKEAIQRSEASVSAELSGARQGEDRAVVLILAVCALGVLMVVAVGLLLARSVLVPLRAILEATRRLGRGELSHRVRLPRTDELGTVAEGFDAMAADLERVHHELSHGALHDTLTGLANRVLLADRVEHALARGREVGAQAALLLVDLDGFKTVNDSHGHLAGDQILIEAAGRLRGLVRAGDTVARVGGDEFGVLLDDVADAQAALAAADEIVAALRAPFAGVSQAVFLGGSIGVAVSTPETHGADELLRNADLAVGVAKQRGKGRAELFVPFMHEEVMTRLALEAELRHAIQAGQLVAHYQPTFDLSTGEVAGAEALVRWAHPTRGLVPPGDFIPLAEQTGLVVPLGWWVLETACHQAKAWQDTGLWAGSETISVNLSPLQLEHLELVNRVGSALETSGLAGSCLVLEITESVMMRDPQLTQQRLHSLKSLGIRIAMDDFGTGYSSLSYLHLLPIDVVKIDKSFVNSLAGAHTHDEAPLVQAIIAMAGSLHLRTVAEGIEETAQRRWLEARGCSLGQGNLFSRPLPPEAIAKFLTDHPPTRNPLRTGVGGSSA